MGGMVKSLLPLYHSNDFLSPTRSDYQTAQTMNGQFLMAVFIAPLSQYVEERLARIRSRSLDIRRAHLVLASRSQVPRPERKPTIRSVSVFRSRYFAEYVQFVLPHQFLCEQRVRGQSRRCMSPSRVSRQGCNAEIASEHRHGDTAVARLIGSTFEHPHDDLILGL
jgi:hypothetical protein